MSDLTLFTHSEKKREKEDLDTDFEWVKSVRSLIHIRIKTNLSGSTSIRSASIFTDPNIASA